MMSIALQIERTAAGMVAAGENVVFDTVAYASGNIGYNSATGVVNFYEAGRYLINWWVTTQSSASVNGAIFAVSTSEGQITTGNSPVKKGEVCGTGIITVSVVPSTASLINQSADAFYYAAQLPLAAGLVITKDTSGSTAETTACFAVAQMAHILSQMITAYAGRTWSVFTSTLATYSGMPLGLYTAPGAAQPALLQLVDVNGDYETLPIAGISAIYPGDGTVYDPSFTFLPAPEPLPPGCDTDLLSAIRSYLPVGTDVSLRMPVSISASGSIYKNEYGVLILSDESGNTPILIASPHIRRIFTQDSALRSALKSGGKNPTISLDRTAGLEPDVAKA